MKKYFSPIIEIEKIDVAEVKCTSDIGNFNNNAWDNDYTCNDWEFLK